MSRAWMPLYVADYLADTGHLSAAEHGAYLLLIMHYWSNGGLPDDDRKLARIARMTAEEWAETSDSIREFFGPGWSHKRIDDELAKASDISERRKASGQSGGRAKWGNSLASENAAKRSERLAAARAIARHSAAEWQALLELFPQCVRCGDDGPLVKDHITPIYQGGSDGIENIQPLCRTCNASKGPETKDFRSHDWRERLAKRLAIVCEEPSSSLARARVPQSQSPSSSLRSEETRAGRARLANEAAQKFEQFWSEWPHKVGKPAAAKAFLKVRDEADEIMAGLPRYIAETERAGRPWLNPATFLNQRRWEDSPAPQPMARAGPSPRGEGVAKLMIETMNRMAENERRNSQNGNPETARLLPFDAELERGIHGADDGGVSRPDVELLIRSAVRRM